MSLKEYKRKRSLDESPEPEGKPGVGSGPLRFVVQKHDATRIHFDLRLEMDGVMKSWAVPKGPSFNPSEQRLAVFVEDHPIEYAGFEGIIPEGHYGAGTVMIWDRGTFVERGTVDLESEEEKRTQGIPRLLEGLAKGHITFVLSGERLKGEFALIRTQGNPKNWILVKKRDEFSSSKILNLAETSIISGRSFQEIAQLAPKEGAIWSRGQKDQEPLIKVQQDFSRGNPKIQKEMIPRKVKLMLPCSERQLMTDAQWLCFPHLDGFRAYLVLDKGSAKLYSRQDLDYTKRYPHIAKSAKALKKSLVLDGIIAYPQEQPSLDQLKKWKTGEGEDGPCFYVYDILHLEGQNTRGLPFKERLQEISAIDLDFIKSTPCLPADRFDETKPFTEFEDLREVLFKHADSAYESGIQTSFLKVPINKQQPEQDNRSLPEASLDILQSKSPEDLLASWQNYSGPVRLSHPERLYFPEDNYRKEHVAAYYHMMAPVILPWLKDHPLSLNRHPNGIHGESFFHKDQKGYLPPYVESKALQSSSKGKTINYLLCQNLDALIYLSNQGNIELNPWFSTWNRPEFPLWGVIDLDPNGRRFEDVIQVALLVHDILDKLEVPHFCKTSGSTGLHIGIPLAAAHTSYDEIREFCLKVCEIVALKLPHLATLERSPMRRRARLYLDCFQNRRSQTLASVYCLRPKLSAPVSTPILWKELGKGLSIEQFNILTVQDRLSKYGDIWSPMATLQADLKHGWKRLRDLYPNTFDTS